MAGNANAMYKLVKMYRHGDGIGSDYEKARELFLKAIDADNSDGIGLLYELGQGLKRDYNKAREWHQKGAKTGNTNAINDLGLIYRDGEGVCQD